MGGSRDLLRESAPSPSVPWSTLLPAPFLDSKADCAFPLLEHLSKSPRRAGDSPGPVLPNLPWASLPSPSPHRDPQCLWLPWVSRRTDLAHGSRFRVLCVSFLWPETPFAYQGLSLCPTLTISVLVSYRLVMTS